MMKTETIMIYSWSKSNNAECYFKNRKKFSRYEKYFFLIKPLIIDQTINIS